ncbi:MAG: hypothetical protein JXR60_08520 [Bacteroidales bacterium]|nr:hypothetical protein [Bacteroidales bacterium]
MEYIVSNINFENFQEFNSVTFEGEVSIENNIISIMDGYLLDDVFNYKDIELNKGVFNKIDVNTSKNTFTIINDKLGQRAVYYYIKDHTFIISNSFWKIVVLLNLNEINVDTERVKEQLYFHRIPQEGITFLKNIYYVPAATKVVFDWSNKKHSITKYWNIKQKPQENITLEDASKQLETSFDELFSFLKKKFPNKKFAFGNSGGLDSRLVPLFSYKHNLNLLGITIGEKKPHKLFTAVSHKNADKIAKLFKFRNYNLRSTKGNFDSRLLLDIRNNPLSGNQVFKNPIEQAPEFDNLICGGNGFIVSNDSNIWEKFEKISLEKRQEFLTEYLSKEKLSIPYKNIFRIKKFIGKSFTIDTSKSLFKKWFSDHDFANFSNALSKFYNEYEHLDNFSLIRQVHMSLLNKQSPNGGLESLNRTKPFFYLYYPFAFDVAMKWKPDFFYDRKVLTNIIKKNNVKLASIPDQKMNKIIGKNNKYLKLLNIIIRRSGMDYNLFSKDRRFRLHAKLILEKYNPLFNEVINGNTISFKEISKTHPHFWLDVVKTKKILDILYYKDFDFVNNKDFGIQ